MGDEIGLKLFYDKENMAIAIQFVSGDKPGLYKLNMSDKYGATSKVRAFLLNNGLDIKKHAGKHEYKKYSALALGLDGSDVFVIELGTGGGTM